MVPVPHPGDEPATTICRWAWSVLAMLLLVMTHPSAAETAAIRLEPDRVLRHGADRVLGINLNYLRDGDANRPAGSRSLDDALTDLGVRWLRYPGGEKSDFHRWSTPPFEAPRSTALGWYATVAGARMDFDAYLAHCARVGATPHVVLAYDNEERTGATLPEFIDHAVAWVRYAQSRTPRVGLWEIGNENWHHQTATPEQMAEVVAAFAAALRPIDPDIRLCASGTDNRWWAAFLPAAGPHLDAVTLSLYNCWDWKSYDAYVRQPRKDLIGPVRKAMRAIDALPSPHRERISVVVAETNSKDYSEGGWSDANSLGHALVLIDTFGQLLAEPRVSSAMQWTTRWADDRECEQSLWYALGPDNRLMATGTALALWARAMRGTVIAATSSRDDLVVHALADPDGDLSLIALNKGAATIHLTGLPMPVAQAWRLAGSGPDDLRPTLGPVAAEDARVCPPYSATACRLAPR